MVRAVRGGGGGEGWRGVVWGGEGWRGVVRGGDAARVAADLLVDEAPCEHIAHLSDHVQLGRHAELLA